MSLNTSDDKQSDKKLVLVSVNSFLQTELLARLIGQEMDTPCSVAKNVDSVAEDISLILIDCSGQDIENLSQTINKLHSRLGDVPAALLNAQYDSEHEKLLDWPSIFGIFYQDTDQEQLVRGLHQLLDGDFWVPRRLLHHFLNKNRKAPANALNSINISLTKREKQILKLIKGGATNAAISEALDVSEHTVKSHLYNVYKKIGVKNRLEASNWVRDVEGLD